MFYEEAMEWRKKRVYKNVLLLLRYSKCYAHASLLYFPVLYTTTRVYL